MNWDWWNEFFFRLIDFVKLGISVIQRKLKQTKKIYRSWDWSSEIKKTNNNSSSIMAQRKPRRKKETYIAYVFVCFNPLVRMNLISHTWFLHITYLLLSPSRTRMFLSVCLFSVASFSILYILLLFVFHILSFSSSL